MEPSVSLDRITLVGRVVSPRVLASLGFLPIDSVRSSHKWIGGYDEDTKVHVSQRGKDMRLDWNPATGAPDVFLEMLGGRHVTRVDVAIDYGLDLSAYEWFSSRRKRVCHYGSDGRLETVYLGRFGSPKMVRVYDKTREQGLTDGVERWRCEGQRRARPNADVLPVDLFDGVSVFPKDVYQCRSLSDAGYLALLQVAPERYRELDRRTRKRLEDEYSSVGLPVAPGLCYQSCRSKLQDSLAERIGV